MRLLRVLRNHPLWLFGVVAFGLGGWMIADSLSPPASAPLPEYGYPDVQSVSVSTPGSETPTPGIVTADVVPQLHPGMMRAEVENLIGLPPADLVDPIAEVDGRFTYRTTYLANLDPPPNTIRPIATRPPPATVPKSLISLEFDASIPGHPLIRVHISARVS